MLKNSRILACCSVVMIVALLVVGAVSHGVIRHIVQTSPLWFSVVLGFRGSATTKWAALPCYAVWLTIMALIWMFLLGWSRIVHGTFSPIEIAMTIVVGAASALGIVRGAATKSGVRAPGAIAITGAVLLLQLAAIRLSLLPQIAHR